MQPVDLADALVPVDDDLLDAVGAVRASLARPGRWLTAAQLLAMTGDEDRSPDLVAAAHGTGDAGIGHGRQLLALAEALVRGAPPLAPAPAAAAGVLDAEQLLGAVATVAAFVLLNRVSDSSGIPLDRVAMGLLDGLPEELALQSYAGARRTSLGGG